MTRKLGWALLFVAVSVVSCEKAIEFKPSNPDPKLVVEGIIENDRYPAVYLTRSLNFFDKISPGELTGSFVRNAVVKISNGTKTHTLKEHHTKISDDIYLYYYTVDSSRLSNAFKGEFEKTYHLEIEVSGEKYEASTTIPKLEKKISRVYYQQNIDEEDSSKVAVYGEFNDPPGLGNYTRYFTAVDSRPFYPGLNSVFDDQIVDGTTYELQIEQGVNRNREISFEEYPFFHKGDSITIKYCNVDKGVFDFWRTMEYSYQSIGNPFSSPTKIKGNISNGALGYFGGYAVQYVKIVIPE